MSSNTKRPPVIYPYFLIGGSSSAVEQRCIGSTFLTRGIAEFGAQVRRAWDWTDANGLPRTYWAHNPGGVEHETIMDFDQFWEAINRCRDGRVIAWAKSWRTGTAPLVVECKEVRPVGYVGSLPGDPDMQVLREFKGEGAFGDRIGDSLEPLALHEIAIDHGVTEEAEPWKTIYTRISRATRAKVRIEGVMPLGCWLNDEDVAAPSVVMAASLEDLPHPELYVPIDQVRGGVTVLCTDVPAALRTAPDEEKRAWRIKRAGFYHQAGHDVVVSISQFDGLSLADVIDRAEGP